MDERKDWIVRDPGKLEALHGRLLAWKTPAGTPERALNLIGDAAILARDLDAFRECVLVVVVAAERHARQVGGGAEDDNQHPTVGVALHMALNALESSASQLAALASLVQGGIVTKEKAPTVLRTSLDLGDSALALARVLRPLDLVQAEMVAKIRGGVVPPIGHQVP